MFHAQYVVDTGTSGCKKQLLELRASTSNHTVAEKSSVFQDDINCWRRKAEIKQLEERLRVLEEEAPMLKGALLASVEERTKLMNEILEQFETIEHSLLHRQLERGELYAHGVQIISLFKHRRAGLLQLLCQESNPWLVNRGLAANALG